MFLNIFLYVLHLYGQDKLRNKLVEMVAYLWLKSRFACGSRSWALTYFIIFIGLTQFCWQVE